MKHLKLFEEHKGHCDVVKKYMKYFSSKRMNKLAWWIDPFHLPRINEMLCESISYYDNDYHGDGYQFSPWSSSDYIFVMCRKKMYQNLFEKLWIWLIVIILHGVRLIIIMGI